MIECKVSWESNVHTTFDVKYGWSLPLFRIGVDFKTLSCLEPEVGREGRDGCVAVEGEGEINIFKCSCVC